MKKVTYDGNEITAHMSYLFTELSSIYPITPSSPMSELVEELSNEGKLNIFNDTVKVIEMQSEAGAAGFMHGSLQAGTLTTTYTSSQGLLLMIPNMYKMAGEMLPGVIHVAARSLSTHALSIFGDHQDIYACRSTGFLMLASSSVQDTAYMSVLSHLVSIKSSLPVLHFFDGFRTSHELNKVNIMDDKEIISLIDYEAIKKFKDRALNPLKPHSIGLAQNDDVYFQNMEARNKYYIEAKEIIKDYMNKINNITGTNFKPFNYYGSNKADKIIVAMGSVCETIKETIDDLNNKGHKVGLIEVHVYRPFMQKEFLKEIPSTTKYIAVLDRTKESGSNGEPLYLDVKNVVSNIKVVGGRYGLSSKNTTPAMIKSVYDNMDKISKEFTIGIEDDITHLSLDYDVNYKISTSEELLIYGYGSDGMVSASKSIIKLVGNSTNKYVQGYFQYDSKKSGGVTISHLRFNNEPIRSTYYCDKPSFIVVTNDTYINKYDVFNNIKDNGTILINTNKDNLDFINIDIYRTLINKKCNIYLIDATKECSEIHKNLKINTMLESAILYLYPLMDYKEACNELIDYAYNNYYHKGKELFEANKIAINDAYKYIKKISLEDFITNINVNILDNSLYSKLDKRQGDLVAVSEFDERGIFSSNTSKLDKRMISENVAKWNHESCISCNQCSIVCPHGVIRPFIIDKNEYDNLPSYIKDKCIKMVEPNLSEYYYTLAISIKDCTGCGLCVKKCPTKEESKALVMGDLNKSLEELEQDRYDYLIENIKEKELINKYTIKGSQFNEPKFCFSGACSGCGETPYIKLLTQLFGKSMIISNATGCSSIYGGSLPSNPYNIPWASSLFEDNAEYGYGILTANNVIKNRIRNIILKDMDNQYNHKLYTKWLENMDNTDITLEVYNNLDYDHIDEYIKENKDNLIHRNIWTIGGDGWAYDIGYGGIDHALASNENVKILVLDTEVYSNTGGQSSKSSHIGSIASFTSTGKKTHKKDLARMAMSIPNVYVAHTCMGYNPMQTLKCFKEANEHDGPAIIIAYSPCISHGIKGGLTNSISSSKMAVECGYFPVFRYEPNTDNLMIDSKNINFDLYQEYLLTQSRYSNLKELNEKEFERLLEENKEHAIKKYEYYKLIANKNNDL